MTYGFEIERGWNGPRSCLADPRLSASGNLILTAGREIHDGDGWTKVADVVMTPAEAERFIVACTLELLRGSLRAENISYGEIATLQDLAEHIDPDDVELLGALGAESP